MATLEGALGLDERHDRAVAVGGQLHSEYTAKVGKPNSRHARITRTAISPRLTIKTFMRQSAYCVSVTEPDNPTAS